MIVDDEDELRLAIAFDFKRKGHIVHEAANGQEALKIVQDHPIDLVISDVRMPHGDGIELLKMIRQRNPKIPIVVLATGFADLSRSEAIQMGAFALIEKPINRKKMFELVEAAFSGIAQ